MWPTKSTLPIRWGSKSTVPSSDHHPFQDVTVPGNHRTMAILDQRRLQRHQNRLIKRQQTASKEINSNENLRTTTLPISSDQTRNNHSYSCNTYNLRLCNTGIEQDSVTFGSSVSDNMIVSACASTVGDEMSRWAKRIESSVVEAGWQFILGVVLVLQSVLLSGVRRFLARFSGRRRLYIPLSPSSYHHITSPWRILALIVVYTSLLSIVDGCSSRNTPKPRPPPTPATAAATTARPNITFLTYECPPAYAAWYCLNGATCFTVKIGDSLLYNCECSEGYMGPRCEYKDLDGSYLPSQRRILLETASIAGGATIALLLMVVLGLVAYVHYCRRQRKEEPPTPPASLTAAQSTLTTTTDTVDGVTRTVTTSCINTQAPRRLPTFGTRWKTQTQQQNQEHSVTRVELQQVTTLLGDCEQAQVQQAQAQLQRQ